MRSWPCRWRAAPYLPIPASACRSVSPMSTNRNSSPGRPSRNTSTPSCRDRARAVPTGSSFVSRIARGPVPGGGRHAARGQGRPDRLRRLSCGALAQSRSSRRLLPKGTWQSVEASQHRLISPVLTEHYPVWTLFSVIDHPAGAGHPAQRQRLHHRGPTPGRGTRRCVQRCWPEPAGVRASTDASTTAARSRSLTSPARRAEAIAAGGTALAPRWPSPGASSSPTQRPPYRRGGPRRPSWFDGEISQNSDLRPRWTVDVSRNVSAVPEGPGRARR